MHEPAWCCGKLCRIVTAHARERVAKIVPIEVARLARATRPRGQPRDATRPSVGAIVADLPKEPETVARIRSMVGLPTDPELAEIRRRLAGEKGDEAARELGRLGTEITIGILEAALADEDRQVRLAGALGLGTAGHAAAQALDALVGALSDPSWEVIIAAARALEGLGANAVRATHAIAAALWSEPWRTAVEQDIGPVARSAMGPALDAFVEAQATEVRGALSDALDAVR